MKNSFFEHELKIRDLFIKTPNKFFDLENSPYMYSFGRARLLNSGYSKRKEEMFCDRSNEKKLINLNKE